VISSSLCVALGRALNKARSFSAKAGPTVVGGTLGREPPLRRRRAAAPFGLPRARPCWESRLWSNGKGVPGGLGDHRHDADDTPGEIVVGDAERRQRWLRPLPGGRDAT
jgi:hypothetical protein